MRNVHDLIVAPATPGSGGARAIVRMAGDALDWLLAGLFAPRAGQRFGAFSERPRLVTAQLTGTLAHEWGGVDVEILHWPGPGGPTGGPLAEVQLPASVPLVEAVVAEACRQGARLAHGGEFSLRSFLAGRLDLLQAEAVLAVVDARTPAELSAALDRMAGGVGRQLQAARETLLDLVADIEAVIDFSDEHAPDSQPIAAGVFWKGIDERLVAISEALAAVGLRLAARDSGGDGRLPRVVIVGRPNIGKSSLFNALVGREAALVADEAGTTRDWIAARLEGEGEDEGVACLLVDVAGIEAEEETGGDSSGQDGIVGIAGAATAAARAEALQADVLIVCRDVGDALPPEPAADLSTGHQIDVVTRYDRRAGGEGDAAQQGGGQAAVRLTSSRDHIGIESLRQAILREVAALPGQATAATLRMRVGLDAAREAVAAALEIAAAARAGRVHDEAVVASFLGRAIAALGEVTGAELGNDLLDRIFARHCIGK